MPPGWAETVGWISLGFGFASALIILADEFLLGHRQHMAIMNLVHPITALYWGPVWLWAYFTRGRKSSVKVIQARAHQLVGQGADPRPLKEQGESVEKIRPWNTANAVSHCGAGCTLGDIGGEWIVWALGPWMLGVTGTLGPELVLDFVLAWTLGVVFQYFTIVPMRENVGKLEGVWQAIRVDTLSIVCFQLGLFGWMALSHELIWSPPLHISTSAHWWMMQVGMVVGFFTAWPVNRWLIRKGWKEKMDHRKHLAMKLEQLQDRQAA